MLESLLAKVQATGLAEIRNMKTLRSAVGFERLVDSPPVQAY